MDRFYCQFCQQLSHQCDIACSLLDKYESWCSWSQQNILFKFVNDIEHDFGAGISTGSVKDKEHKTLVRPLYASLMSVSLCVPLLQVQVFGSFSTGLYLPTRCVIDHIYLLRTCMQAYWLGCTIHKGKSAIVYIETLNSTSTQNHASKLLSLLFSWHHAENISRLFCRAHLSVAGLICLTACCSLV